MGMTDDTRFLCSGALTVPIEMWFYGLMTRLVCYCIAFLFSTTLLQTILCTALQDARDRSTISP